MENHQLTKGKKKTSQNNQKAKKKKNGGGKSLHINNLPKCKQMELINQEAQTGWVFKKENYMLLTGDIFQL